MVDRPSKWQQTWNILSPYVTEPINAMQRLMTTPYEVLVGGPSPAFDQAVADSLALSGTVTGGSAMIPKPSNAMAMGIKAFHGSPHSFDKFSMGKIGTGEGAQAYGHGLYFAENEGVAQGYQKKLTRVKNYIIDGVIRKHGGIDNAIDALTSEIKDLSSTTFSQNLPGSQKLLDKQIAQRQSMLESLIARKTEGQANPGSMYEVDINADPNAFLDWDKPLSEQPEVQARLATIGEAARSSTTRGVDKYISLENMLDNRAAVTEKLKEAGIPGIKYLDAGSRGVGDGTRNYVVFDDRLISIVRKYGIAGASAYLGYDILKNVSEAQAEELRKIEKGTR